VWSCSKGIDHAEGADSALHIKDCILPKPPIMDSSNPAASNHRRPQRSSAAVVTGVAIACSISTQFIAWRVSYHLARRRTQLR